MHGRSSIPTAVWSSARNERRGPSKKVNGVAFSPEGRRIVSGSSDSTLHVWPAPAAWGDELCAKLTRNMSHRQWSEWASPEIPYVVQCPGLPVPSDEAQVAAASGER
jgi:WD40 repeat protein